MTEALPEKVSRILEKKVFASVATIMPDGTPQVSPVWCEFDGKHIVFNTARGRQKDKNMQRDPRVSVCMVNPDNPYEYAEVRGRVVQMTEQGADAHADKLAKKYLGLDSYPYRKPNEVRVIVRIDPEYVHVMG